MVIEIKTVVASEVGRVAVACDGVHNNFWDWWIYSASWLGCGLYESLYWFKLKYCLLNQFTSYAAQDYVVRCV